MENDPSLMNSLEIATELGYTTEKLNAELLATLLYQKSLEEDLNLIMPHIEAIFINAKK